MPVTWRIAYVGNNCCFMRRDDHFRIGVFGQNRLRNRIAIVGTVSNEFLDGRLDLTDQIRYGCRVAYFRCGQFARDNFMFLINGNMQLAPSAPV